MRYNLNTENKKQIKWHLTQAIKDYKKAKKQLAASAVKALPSPHNSQYHLIGYADGLQNPTAPKKHYVIHPTQFSKVKAIIRKRFHQPGPIVPLFEETLNPIMMGVDPDAKTVEEQHAKQLGLFFTATGNLASHFHRRIQFSPAFFNRFTPVHVKPHQKDGLITPRTLFRRARKAIKRPPQNMVIALKC